MTAFHTFLNVVPESGKSRIGLILSQGPDGSGIRRDKKVLVAWTSWSQNQVKVEFGVGDQLSQLGD